jgi:hypothetical protein
LQALAGLVVELARLQTCLQTDFLAARDRREHLFAVGRQPLDQRRQRNQQCFQKLAAKRGKDWWRSMVIQLLTGEGEKV